MNPKNKISFRVNREPLTSRIKVMFLNIVVMNWSRYNVQMCKIKLFSCWENSKCREGAFGLRAWNDPWALPFWPKNIQVPNPPKVCTRPCQTSTRLWNQTGSYEQKIIKSLPRLSSFLGQINWRKEFTNRVNRPSIISTLSKTTT